jgi:hypothetical protein
MRSMSGATQGLSCGEAHFMFLGEAPRNVREKRRIGAEQSARFMALLTAGLRARIGAAHAALFAFARHE